MKTFKQWYEERSDAAKQYLDTCNWVDTTTETYYKNLNTSEPTLESVLRVDTNRWSYSSTARYKLIGALLRQRLDEGKLTDEEFMKYIKTADLYNSEEFLAYFPTKYWQLATKVNAEYRWEDQTPKYDFKDLLFITEDFEHIDWNLLKDDVPLNPAIVDILDHDVVINKAKTNPRSVKIYGTEMNNDLVDELWFGENGWTDEQKMQVLRDYPMSTDGIVDFMKRFVTVDEGNLRFIKVFINWEPALASKVYHLQKPDTELAAYGEKVPTQARYRFPTNYRKLFLIAGCCARENVGKTMTGTIKEVASLLKLYNWNFDMIFDCLFPQHARQVETEEETC